MSTLNIPLSYRRSKRHNFSHLSPDLALSGSNYHILNKFPWSQRCSSHWGSTVLLLCLFLLLLDMIPCHSNLIRLLGRGRYFPGCPHVYIYFIYPIFLTSTLCAQGRQCFVIEKKYTRFPGLLSVNRDVHGYSLTEAKFPFPYESFRQKVSNIRKRILTQPRRRPMRIIFFVCLFLTTITTTKESTTKTTSKKTNKQKIKHPKNKQKTTTKTHKKQNQKTNK